MVVYDNSDILGRFFIFEGDSMNLFTCNAKNKRTSLFCLSTIFIVGITFFNTSLLGSKRQRKKEMKQRVATMQNLGRLRDQVNVGASFEEATKTAAECAQSTDSCVQIGALGLFADLVKNGHAYQPATQAAIQTIDTPAQQYALWVCEELVKKGQAIKEIEEALKKDHLWQNNNALIAKEILRKIAEKQQESKNLAAH